MAKEIKYGTEARAALGAGVDIKIGLEIIEKYKK